MFLLTWIYDAPILETLNGSLETEIGMTPGINAAKDAKITHKIHE